MPQYRWVASGLMVAAQKPVLFWNFSICLLSIRRGQTIADMSLYCAQDCFIATTMRYELRSIPDSEYFSCVPKKVHIASLLRLHERKMLLRNDRGKDKEKPRAADLINSHNRDPPIPSTQREPETLFDGSNAIGTLGKPSDEIQKVLKDNKAAFLFYGSPEEVTTTELTLNTDDDCLHTKATRQVGLLKSVIIDQTLKQLKRGMSWKNPHQEWDAQWCSATNMARGASAPTTGSCTSPQRDQPTR